MDIPAIVILVAICFCVGAICAMKFRLSRERRIATILLLFVLVWIVVDLLGEFLLGLGGNAACSSYLGCVTGFSGYDAFEHLFSGIAFGLGVLWMNMKYPKYSMASQKRWKTIFTAILVVVFLSVLWEMCEYIHDAFRLDVLHEHLLNIRFHRDLLDQPSNDDTMGDITYSLLGGIISTVIAFFVDPKVLTTDSSVESQ